MGTSRPGGVIHTDIVIHLKADAERAKLSGARDQAASEWRLVYARHGHELMG